MRTLLPVLGILMFVSATPAPGTPGPSGLTLEEAKRQAFAHNYELLALRKTLEEAEAERSIVLSRFWPRLGMAGGVQSGGNGIRDTIGIGYLYSSVNIFKGFEDSYQTDIADIELEKALVRLQKGEFRLGLEVEAAFFQNIYLKRALELNEEALVLNDAHKALMRKRKAVSLVSDTDVMEYELRDALLRSDTAGLEQERAAARLELQKVLSLESELTTEPQGVLQHWHLKTPLQELQKASTKQGESALLAQKDLAQADIESKRWRSKWWPEVDVEAQAGYLSLDDRPDTGGTLFRGVLLAKWELFSGFETVAQRKRGIARRARAEARLKAAELGATTGVASSYRKIRAIEARVHLEERNRTRAKRYYDSVLGEYRRGVRNSADVRQAAQGLLEAGLRQERFKYDFITERVALERLLGASVSVEVKPEVVLDPNADHEFLKKSPSGSP